MSKYLNIHFLTKSPFLTISFIAIFIIGLSMRIPMFQLDQLGRNKNREATAAMTSNNLYTNGFSFDNVRTNQMVTGTEDFVVFRAEFPLFQTLITCFYHVFGPHIVIGKIINFLFFTLACVFLAIIAGLYGGGYSSLYAFSVSYLAPIGLYYSCTFQRIGVIYFCLMGFILFLTLYCRTNKIKYALFCCLCCCICSILHYARALELTILFLTIQFSFWGKETYKKPSTYWIMPLSGLLPAAWLLYTIYTMGGTGQFTSGGNDGLRDFGNFSYWFQWWDTRTATEMWNHVVVFGVGAITLPVFLMTFFLGGKKTLLAVGCFTAVFAFVVFDSYPFFIAPHPYYFIDIVLLSSLVIGIGLNFLHQAMPKPSQKYYLTASILIIICYSYASTGTKKYLYEYTLQEYEKELIGNQFIAMTKNEGSKNVALVGMDADTMLYKLNTIGWGLNVKSDPEAEFERLENLNADYLLLHAMKSLSPDQKKWIESAKTKYRLACANRWYALYDLQSPPSTQSIDPDQVTISKLEIPYVHNIFRIGERTFVHGKFQGHLTEITIEDNKAEIINEIEITTWLKAKPNYITNASDDSLLILTNDPPCITQADFNGKIINTFELPEEGKYSAIAKGDGDFIYAASLANNSILQINNFSSSKTFGGLGHTIYPDKLQSPWQLSYHNQLLYVADMGNSRAMVYDDDFNLRNEQGTSYLTKLGRITCLAPLSDGSLILGSDTSDSIVWLDKDGIPKLTLGFNDPYALYYLEESNILLVGSWSKQDNKLFTIKLPAQ